ncbi:MAG: UvrD-helicase domain-containing protein [Deltaproteobacteria bacterium]|jgi:DNA helicase-2/ATP-dependent DNA helicase PcrA|nr:UvrD-helicase domain-containing protein [Deltaproteobacteria bacterium]
MDYLVGLNESQKKAVTTTEGPVRVAAGPGAGKTRALTSRYCYLVDRYGVPPGQILTSTFTNKAANEMRRRVRDYLGDMDLGFICTFHSFCVRFLHEEINVVNFPQNFVILDPEDQKQILSQIFEDMFLGLKDLTVKQALDSILEARKLKAVSYIDYFYLMDNEELKKDYLTAADRDDAIFLRYVYEQKKLFGLDFNDLIAFTIYILQGFPEIRQKWQKKMQYVMVDEFQDVSARQYELARLLAGGHGNIFIVGDPDQTIYTWRGAHVRLFLDFTKIYPNAAVIDLGLNYRSTPQILAVADSLIQRNSLRVPRILKANNPDGPKPVYCHAKTDSQENEWVCQEIEKLRKSQVSLSDVAILYRAHSYVTRDIEERLTEKKIPYQIFSGVEFYRRREVKDVVCYLRMIAYGDDAAFLRTHNVPRRKIGKKTLSYLRDVAENLGISLYQALKNRLGEERLKGTKAREYVLAIEKARAMRAHASLDNLLQTILDLSGYETYIRLQGEQERLDNVADLKRSLAAFAKDEEATLEDFLVRAALFSDVDKEKSHESVKLMTIHAAKGLEFKRVFLMGLSEGVLPSRRSHDPEDVEEERRLAYVAMTRAIDALYLSDSAGKTLDGHWKTPSRFLIEMGRENLDFVNPVEDSIFPKSHPSRLANLSLDDILPEGAQVVHQAFGLGRIVKVDLNARVYVIKFDDLPTARSLRLDAPIKRVAP